MDEPEPSQRANDRSENARDRRIANLVLLGLFVVVVGAGLWLVNVMFDQRVMDDCVFQGRRNCAPPIDVPGR